MNLLSLIREIKWKYLFRGSYCRVCRGGTFIVGKNVSISKSRIYVYPGSIFVIDDNTKIDKCIISVDKGECTVGHHSIIGSPKVKNVINIENGILSIGSYSYINTHRLWIRFGGKCVIGNYNNINSGSVIRCDSLITVGDYNQISYNVYIWDTNTHCILKKEERRAITEEHFPYFGFEKEKPVTAPVKIGDDCWIGQNATILKGSIIHDEVIVGYGCFIAGRTIPAKSTVVNDIQLKAWQRND
jgi:acetyltransferase-like isoleucine patch superfamily enzyme